MAIILFPVHVWELILGELDDSIDILNAFIAYPELKREGVLRRTRHIWLFEQVLPHIFPWLKEKELLSCRQVCRKWHRTVDSFLENHPTHRAYSHANRITGQHWIPDASSTHYNLHDHFEGYIFNEPELLHEFFHHLKDRPPERNPFIGRFVEFSDENAVDGEYNIAAINSFWNGVLQVLQKYGKHICFLKLSFHFTLEKLFPFFLRVVKILQCVPNLRSYSIHFDRFAYLKDEDFIPIQKYFEGGNVAIPQYLHIESLDLDSYFRHQFIVDLYVNHCSDKIRRLAIYHRDWKRNYGKMFPKLTELTIKFISSEVEITELLLSLDAPGLYKLKMTPWAGTEYDEDCYIAKWLKPFPQLNILEMSVRHFRKNFGTLTMSTSIPSIKSVTLNDFCTVDELNFAFLRYVPSIEYLKLVGSHVQKHFDPEELYDSNLWRTSPKLREITVVVTGFPKGVRNYTRIAYEYRKRHTEIVVR